MFLAGIPHRPTGHGKCGPRPSLSLINYPAELSCEDVIGLVSPTNLFRGDTSPHVRLPDVARR
ncbi:MAG: hypothetical protein OJF50_006003 [Nitrospira sp.]|jgi:hypothetical protein|nr:hypothetical protein [Nitrospira sp.]